MWSGSSKILSYDELKSVNYEVWGKKRSAKRFVMVIRGNLPLGDINIKAIKIENGRRERTFISPDKYDSEDHKANILALTVHNLDREKNIQDRSHIEPGKYYIYLEQNNTELASGELYID